MKNMTMGSLFDGIGGFPLAAVRNGIVPVWASEIEAFPMEVTKIRFPDMLHLGDITKINGGEIPPVDIICGGSPCQDLSVAGKRAGLEGERSGLFMDQVRIVKEMRIADEQRGRAAQFIRPRYMVWENVPGAFSSAEGEDFRAVLEEIVRVNAHDASIPRPDTGTWKSAGAILLGREFSLAWRVLDAQYWGVPQRRCRIFLVADFGGVTAPEILFKQNGLFGDFAESQGEGQGTSAPAQNRIGDTGRADESIGFDGYAGDLTGSVSSTLGTNCGMSTGRNGIIKSIAFATNQRDEVRDLHDVSGALQAQPGMKQQTFVANTNKISSFHVNQRDEVIDLNGLSGALLATRNMQMQTFVAQAPLLALNDQGGNRMDVTEEITATLRAGMSGHPPLVAQPSKYTAGFVGNAGADAGSIGYQEECAPTLRTGTAPTVLSSEDYLVMATQQGGAEIGKGICPTITASAGLSGNNQPVLLEKQHKLEIYDNNAQDCRYTGPLGVAPTITASFGSGGNNTSLVKNPIAFSLDSKDSNSMKSNNPSSGCRETDKSRTIDTTSPNPSKNQGGLAILQPQESFCIAGNIIDREVQNGGNGLGCQSDISYTLTGADRHAVYKPEPYQEVVGALMCRDHKGVNTTYVNQNKCVVDRNYQETIGALCMGDHKGIGNQYVSQDKCIIDESSAVFGGTGYADFAEGVSTLRASGGTNGGGSENLAVNRNLVRRLTPLECERLQGFPDGWTEIPKCSDSARYKALGNSVAIPCVTFVMRGIAYFLQEMEDD